MLTIFQPFWHRFFWNCLRTSATLVALFKCTSRESLRRSEAWTFTTLEGWTRKAEPKIVKCLKKILCYWQKHQVSKQIGECEEWNAPRRLFRAFMFAYFTYQRMEASRWALQENQFIVCQCSVRGAKHWSRSVCSGALCCSDPVLALTGFHDIRLVRIYFENLFSIAW